MKYSIDFTRELFMTPNVRLGVGASLISNFITSFKSLIPRGGLAIIEPTSESAYMRGVIPCADGIYLISYNTGTSKVRIYLQNLALINAPTTPGADFSAYTNEQVGEPTGAGKFFQGSIFCTVVNGDLYRFRLSDHTWVAITSGTGQALNGVFVHSPADDKLYSFSATAIYVLTSATATLTNVFTLPTQASPTAACAVNSFLYVGMTKTYGNSFIAVWDNTTALTTLAANIPIGPGTIIAVEKLESGKIICITKDSTGLLSIFQIIGEESTLIAQYGDGRYVYEQLPTNGVGVFCDGKTINFAASRYDVDPNSGNTNTVSGIFSVNGDGQMVLATSFDSTRYGAGSATTGTAIYKQGEYYEYAAIVTSGTLPELLKTTSSNKIATYDSHSYGPKIVKEKNVGVTISSEPLASSGSPSIALYQRSLPTMAWVLVGTHSTAGSGSTSFLKYNDAGEFGENTEQEWRIVCTNDARPTGLFWETEFVDDRQYGSPLESGS